MPPEFYNATEAARILDVSEKTVTRRIKSGVIPATKKLNENRVEEWQIPAEYVAAHKPDKKPDIAGWSPDVAGYNKPDTTRQPMGFESESQPDGVGDNQPDTPGQQPNTATGRAPDTTGQRALGRLEGYVARDMENAIHGALEPVQNELARVLETNRQMVSALEALQAAQNASEASRAQEAQSARESAEKRDARMIEIANAQADIQTENERLRNENEALKSRGFWARMAGN